jgi:hypothetical protein
MAYRQIFDFFAIFNKDLSNTSTVRDKAAATIQYVTGSAPLGADMYLVYRSFVWVPEQTRMGQ